jgi:hypothetical protein
MKKRRKAKITRRVEPTRRWPTYSLMIVCGLLIVTGFFFAGRQHFSSMDYGMKNSRLRKQIDDLEAEKRRLVLAREVSLSPTEIRKAAKRSGITSPPAENEVAQVASATKQKALPSGKAEPNASGLVVKTASVSAAPRTVAATYPKAERTAKQERKTALAE